MFNFWKKKEEEHEELKIFAKELQTKFEESKKAYESSRDTNITVREYVVVEGYKGMTKDMKAYNDFQYEVGKIYKLDEGEEAVKCQKGFHLCLNLKDCMDYYNIGNGNRFFKVRAIVDKQDYDSYGAEYIGYYQHGINNKLVSHEIEIVEEVPIEELYEWYIGTYRFNYLITLDDFKFIKDNSLDDFQGCMLKPRLVQELVDEGFTSNFVNYIYKSLGMDDIIKLYHFILAMKDEIEDRDLLIMLIVEEKTRIEKYKNCF